MRIVAFEEHEQSCRMHEILCSPALGRGLLQVAEHVARRQHWIRLEIDEDLVDWLAGGISDCSAWAQRVGFGDVSWSTIGQAAGEGTTLASKLKTYTAPSIPVIDDVGPLPMERGAASALHQ